MALVWRTPVWRTSGGNSFDHCAKQTKKAQELISDQFAILLYMHRVWRITWYVKPGTVLQRFKLKCWAVLNFLKIIRVLIGQISWIRSTAEDPFSKCHIPVNPSLVLWGLDGMETHSPFGYIFDSSSLLSLEFLIQAIYNSYHLDTEGSCRKSRAPAVGRWVA